MSSTSHAVPTTSTSTFKVILDNALKDYTKKTGIDLAKYDFAKQIEGYNTPDEVLWLFREKAKQFKEYREGNRRLINWLEPIVKVVHVLSGCLGEAISVHPFSPAKAIFVGVDVLLVAAMGVSTSYDALVDLFECAGNFLKRLGIYTEMPVTDGIMDITTKIMTEVLSVLALATKQIKQGRLKKFAKKLLGESEIEAVLQRLDRLTQDEARVTVAQTLQVVYGLVNNVKSVMEDGKVSTDGFRQALVTMQKTAIGINKLMRDQLQDKVRHWLAPPDPSTNHNTACEVYQKVTAAWFLQGKVFAKWKAIGPLLWIHGKPGSGKSTLLSSIIQALDEKQAAGLASVTYYYFDFRDVNKQDRQGLLSSLLVQLSAESNPCYEMLSSLYSTHAPSMRRPTDAALTQCLKDMLKCRKKAATFIIIDALDECPKNSGLQTAREKVFQLVEMLVDFQLPNLRICVASRPEVDIREVLEPLSSLQVSLHDESGQRNDILDFITKVVHTDPKMCKWREEDKELVIKTLSEKSDGMFRWAFCQLDALRRSFPASIRGALNELPKGLDETYEKTLLSIDEEKLQYARRLFQCLTVATRPLRLDELAEVLAIRFNSDSLPNYNVQWRSGDAEEAVFSACSSLITLSEVNGAKVVQYSHFSVKEFLTSDHLEMNASLSHFRILPGPAHTIMGKACLSVLLNLDHSIDKTINEKSPLALYAARHWVEHIQVEDASPHIQNALIHLFDPDKPHFAAWIWLHDIDRHWGKHMSTPHPTRPQASPLYYAALCGFYGLVKHLVLARPLDVNVRGGYHLTPLHASLGRGHRDITPLLLEHGASVDVRDNDGATPLHRACRAGNLDVVRLLLEHNADVNAETGKQELPLHFAASEGEAEISRLLLDCKVEVNCKDNRGWSPLHSASRHGHLSVVNILLDCGADVNTKKKDGWTSLHLASANGKTEIVQLLIQRSADVNIINDKRETPLDWAVGNGNVEIARILLESGASVKVTDKQGWTPLHTAARNGNCSMARLLLGFEANLHARTETQKTALALACSNGKLEVAKFLIDCGSDMNSLDKEGRTLLHSAARHGHLEILQLLLERGADANAHKADAWSPLHLVSANGYLNMAKLLIRHGADVNSRNNKRETPLDRASGNGHIEIVRLLIECRADVSSRDDKGWTPFHSASKSGHIRVAKLLLEHGVNVDVRNGNQETALDLASIGGKIEVVRFLIEQGANTHAKDNKGWNPLHGASQNGHLDIVRLLVQNRTAIDIQDGTKKTPLALAASKGKVNVARFLIDKGADKNARDEQSWAPLHLASRFGHVDMVQLLLDRRVDPNLTKDDRWSSLHLASANGHLGVVQLLVQRGATVDLPNEKQQTALDRAASKGKIEIVRFLIEHKANVHVTDSSGCTPLHAASQNGHLDVVKLLLRRGADVHALNSAKETPEKLALESDKAEVARFLAEYKTDPNGRINLRSTALDTADRVSDEDGKDEEKASLHSASKEGKVDEVKSLLDRGADVNALNAFHKTPLDLAATKGNLDVVRLLLDRGAEVDSRDRFGWTPLHKASRCGHVEVTRVLIRHGANMNARKQDHWTPMHLSARNGHLGVVQLLLDHGADPSLVNDEGRTPHQLSLGKGHGEIADVLREKIGA